MIWHRLRGHTIKYVQHHRDTSTYNIYGGVEIESGTIDHVAVCSCGRIWLHIPIHALTNKRTWV
jgi:hypothetical protein